MWSWEDSHLLTVAALPTVSVYKVVGWVSTSPGQWGCLQARGLEELLQRCLGSCVRARQEGSNSSSMCSSSHRIGCQVFSWQITIKQTDFGLCSCTSCSPREPSPRVWRCTASSPASSLDTGLLAWIFSFLCTLARCSALTCLLTVTHSWSWQVTSTCGKTRHLSPPRRLRILERELGDV